MCLWTPFLFFFSLFDSVTNSNKIRIFWNEWATALICTIDIFNLTAADWINGRVLDYESSGCRLTKRFVSFFVVLRIGGWVMLHLGYNRARVFLSLQLWDPNFERNSWIFIYHYNNGNDCNGIERISTRINSSLVIRPTSTDLGSNIDSPGARKWRRGEGNVHTGPYLPVSLELWFRSSAVRFELI